MIFEKYRLQEAVETASDKGGGVAILHKFLIFEISDQNKFFVTKTFSSSRWSCIYISILKLTFPYIAISQFDIWWMSKFFCEWVAVTFTFIYVMYQLSSSGLYILIYLTLIISDRCLKNIFFVT